jgi:hypothetical protein
MGSHRISGKSGQNGGTNINILYYLPLSVSQLLLIIFRTGFYMLCFLKYCGRTADKPQTLKIIIILEKLSI